jgi:hypothetical protein
MLFDGGKHHVLALSSERVMETPEPSVVKEGHTGKRALVVTGIKEIGTLVGHGLWALVSTLAILAVVGLLPAAACAWMIPEKLAWRLLAALLVLTIFVAEGWLLGLKRALATMIVVAVRRFGIARRALGLLFDGMGRLLSARALDKVQRLPLRQAEELLREAIAPLSGEVESAGWFRRFIVGWVHRRLVKWVALLTLAEFRRTDADHGGIELAVVHERLAVKIDQLVEKRVLGGVRKMIWMIVGITLIVALAASVGVRMWRLRAAATVPSTVPASAPIEAG